MNWSKELLDSLFWVLQTLALTAVIFSLAVWALVKTTRWAAQFWEMAGGYLSPKRSVKPLLFFLLVISFEILEVRISLIYSNWYNTMYSSLQELNATVFWQKMIVFAFIAASSVTSALISYYLNQRFSINWIEWLNQSLVEKWLNKQAYYKTQYVYNQLDNPDQRIQQDVQSYVKTSLSLSTGVISSVTSMISYTLLLWGLAGSMQLLGIEIPHMMVFLVFGYVIVSTAVAFWLGKPLIKLSFANERLNANYRYSLIRVREYAESIAFYMGEKAEKVVLYQQFNSVIANMWAIVFRTLKFSGFNLIVSQISVVFPLLIQVGRYFEKQIKLGDLMQTVQVFGRLHSNLSYFREVYDSFAEYKATLDRLTGFNQSINHAQQAGDIDIQYHPSQVVFKQVSVQMPTGQTLIDNLNFSLEKGQSLLIKGPSGSGKTTLLRTVAGLWSYAQGDITCPEHSLFLPQKAYIPQGRLLDALYYPQPTPEQSDMAYTQQLLQQVQLGHLADKLLQENDWTRVLSLGEQQRLAFARALLQRPDVLFLDEATASMDEGLEDAMYRLLASALPQTIIISVGHRSTLSTHHQHQLTLNSNGQNWQFI
ncbi:MAG: ABC transporter ATP-binding protein/permease [Pasteurellaceae bacterium]|nr:ABC transporter ATP-binding protein/permease [Pasteurellaceae bacterium]